jgi:antitoxin (DNA-binding transcriptional repressor) of toxin-antitoxin stability system
LGIPGQVGQNFLNFLLTSEQSQPSAGFPLVTTLPVIHKCFTMSIVSIRDMRLSFPKVEALLQAGEEVWIAKRGKPFARIVLDTPPPAKKPDWAKRFGPDGPKPLRTKEGITALRLLLEERDDSR